MISKKNLNFLTKLSFIIAIIYTIFFISLKIYDISQNSKENEKLQSELKYKKNETNNIKAQIKIVEKRTQKIKNDYLNQEELEKKINKIFNRMSVLDYKLSFINLEKMCLDRYIIVTQVNSKSQEGKKAALGILSYLGEVKQNSKSENIYFVDFILQKENK